MKKTIFTLLALFLAGYGMAQGTRAPKSAQDDLAKRLPEAVTPKWEQEGDHFEAEWMENGREVAILYSKTGEYMMTEKEISTIDLPAVVVNGISSKYKTATLHEAEVQQRAVGNETYQVEFTYQGQRMEITVDYKGNILTEEIEGTEGGDGSDGTDQD